MQSRFLFKKIICTRKTRVVSVLLPACKLLRTKSFEVLYQGNPFTEVLTYAVLNHQSLDVFTTDSLLKQQEWKAKK